VKTVARLALLALLGLLGMACNACAPTLLTTAGVSVDDLATYAGVAFCREPRAGSFAFVRTGLAPTEDAAVRAHEERHKAQYRRWVSCAAFDAYYATDSGYVQTEGEASAVQFCVMVASGVDSVMAQADLVERITRQGRQKRHAVADWDAQQALAAFLPCPVRDGAPEGS
jgi:hypothetical protein